MAQGHEVAQGYVAILPETSKFFPELRKQMAPMGRVMQEAGQAAGAGVSAALKQAMSADDFTATLKSSLESYKAQGVAAAREVAAAEKDVEAARAQAARAGLALQEAEQRSKAVLIAKTQAVEAAEQKLAAAKAQTGVSVDQVARLEANLERARADAAASELQWQQRISAANDRHNAQLSAMASAEGRLAQAKQQVNNITSRTKELQSQLAAETERASARQSTALSGLRAKLAEVSGRIRGMIGEASSAGSSMHESFGSASGAAGSMISVVGRLGGAISALAAPAAVFSAGWKRATDLQAAEIRFRSMGVEGEAFTKTMEMLNGVVKGTTASLSDASAQAAMMMTSGVKDSDKLREAMEAMVTASAAGGAELNDLGLVFRQVAAAGKLQAEDANQLQERSIPIWAWLSKTMGKSISEIRDMASEGKISFDDMVRAVKDNGGSLAKDMGQTFSGQLSMLKSSFSRLGEQVATPLMNLGTAVLPKVTAAFDAVGRVVKNVKKFFEEGGIAADVLKVALAGITAASVVAGVMGLVTQFGLVARVMGLASRAMQILNLSFLASPIGMVVAAVGALTAGFVILWKKSESFRNFWKGLWDGVKAACEPVVSWFGNAWDAAVDKVKAAWDRLTGWASDLGGTLSAAWGEVKAAFTGGDDGAGALSDLFGEKLGGGMIWDVAKWSGTMVDKVKQGWSDIQAAFSWGKYNMSAGEADDEVGGWLLWDVAEGAGDAWRVASETAAGWWDQAKQRMSTGWDSVTAAAGTVADQVQVKWDQFKNWWSTSAVPALGGAWENIKTKAGEAADWVQSKWEAIKGPLGNLFGGAFDSLKNAFADLKASLGDAFGGIWDSLKSAGAGVWEALVDVFHSLIDAAKGLWDSLKKVWEVISPLLVPVLKVVAGIIGGVVIGAIFGAIKVVTILVKVFAGVVKVVGVVIAAAIKVAGVIINVLGKAFAWVVDHVMPIFTGAINVAASVFGWLVDKAKAIGPAIGAVFGWVADKAQWFGGILKTVWDAIVAAAKVAFQIVGTVVLTPLMLLWNMVSAAFKWAWENLIKPAWDALCAAAQWMWDSVLKPTWDGIKDGWDLLAAGFQWAWDNLIKPAWDALCAGAQWMWDNVLKPAWDAIKAGWDALAAGLQWAWDNIIKPAWDALCAGANWMWQNVLVPAWDGIKAAWDVLASGINWVWENVIKRAFDGWCNIANWLWQNVLVPAWDGIKAAWEGLGDGIQWVYENVIKKTFNWFKDLAGDIKNAFDKAVDGIRAAWSTVYEFVKKPIKAVVDFVYNNGIRPAWNAVAKLTGLEELPEKTFQEAPEGSFARGGILPGYTPGRDIWKFTSQSGHVLNLSGGEAIMRPEFVKAVGPDMVDGINAAARRGGAGGVKKFLGGFAEGGIIGSIQNIVGEKFPGMTVTSTYRAGDPGYHGRGMAVDFSDGYDDTPGMQAAAKYFAENYGSELRELIHSPFGTNIKDGKSVGDGFSFYGASTMAQHRNHVHVAADHALAGGGKGGVMGFLKGAVQSLTSTVKSIWDKMINATVGKIPSFAGVIGQLPMAAFNKLKDAAWAKIKGKADEQSAPPMPAGGSGGAEQWRGLVESVLRAKGQPVELADTVLRRMNQESGGNPAAINNWDSNAAAGTPSKGLMQVIDPTFRANADPGFDTNIWDPESNIRASMNYAIRRYGSLSAAYNRAGGYDKGGWLKPMDGLQAVYNHSGEPEPVFTASQWRTLSSGLDAAQEMTGKLEDAGVGKANAPRAREAAAAFGGAVARGINDGFKDAQSAVGGFVQNVQAAGVGLVGMAQSAAAGAAVWVGDQVRGAQDAVGGFVKTVQAAGSEISVAFAGGDNGYGGLRDLIGEGPGKAVAGAAGWLGDQVRGAQNAVADFTKTVGIASTELTAAFAGGDNGYGALMALIGEPAAKGISDATAWVGAQFRGAQNAVNGFVRDINAAGSEIATAFAGGDNGYGALRGFLGDHVGRAVADSAAWLGDQVRGVQAAVDDFTRTVGIASTEVSTAFAGGDYGYGALGSLIGNPAGKAVADSAAWVGDQVRGVQKFVTDQAMGAVDWVSKNTPPWLRDALGIAVGAPLALVGGIGQLIPAAGSIIPAPPVLPAPAPAPVPAPAPAPAAEEKNPKIVVNVEAKGDPRMIADEVERALRRSARTSGYVR